MQQAWQRRLGKTTKIREKFCLDRPPEERSGYEKSEKRDYEKLITEHFQLSWQVLRRI